MRPSLGAGPASAGRFWHNALRSFLPLWMCIITGLRTRFPGFWTPLAAHNRYRARTAALIMWRSGLRESPKLWRLEWREPRLPGIAAYSAGSPVQNPAGPHGAAASRPGAALLQLAGQPLAPGPGAWVWRCAPLTGTSVTGSGGRACLAEIARHWPAPARRP